MSDALPTSDPLDVPPEALGAGTGCRCEVVPDAATLAEHFADSMIEEFRAADARGQPYVVFIVPPRCTRTG